jgi:hypothetical protein
MISADDSPVGPVPFDASGIQRSARCMPRHERRLLARSVVAELRRRRTPRDLHPKQRMAFRSHANELLYGGAAGGGKSHLMRRAAIQWCQWIPGLQVYIFRREFPDLFKNHMEGPGSFPVLLASLIARKEARIIWGKNQIRFRNGSVIHLCHCQHEKDVFGYQGAEIHVLMIDELTQWTRKMYTFLRSRVRLGKLRVPRWLKHLFPRILCGANPGGIGHNWVKADFIDLAPPLALIRMPKSEGGMLRQYIPALLEDNPSLVENDPDYEARLEGLGDPALVRAMRRGDWDIVSGGMFDDLWDRTFHTIQAFPIPPAWKIYRAFDWGSSRPFSVGWWAESDGTEAVMRDGARRSWPRGTLFRIAEWYGWDGKTPDTGIKLPAERIGAGIVERETRMGIRGRVKPGPADSSIFDAEPGRVSIGTTLANCGATFIPADKSPGSRKLGWEAIRSRLSAVRDAAREQRPMDRAGLLVFNHCTQFIRTVPTLPRDEHDRDDVNTKAEDHIGDETRYMVRMPAHAVHTKTVTVTR